MVSVSPLSRPATPETQSCIVLPLVDPSGRWRRLKSSLSLCLSFLSIRIAPLLCAAPLFLVYSISSCKMELSVADHLTDCVFGSLH
jgi:hypothetical protein